MLLLSPLLWIEPESSPVNKYCKRGHHLEPKLAQELQKSSDEGETPFKLHAIYSLGMVRCRDKPYIKDSIDFLAIADIDGEVKVIGLEMKARVASSTDQQERLSSEFSQSQNSETNVLTYFVMDWNSGNLGQYITCAHEAVQILHHAYTFDLEYVALIVGDNNGDIIRGVFVKFDSDIKLAYGNVMTPLYNFCLKWAYDNTESKPELLNQVLNTMAVTRSEFDQMFALWHFLSNKMTLPIPPVSRIIPLVLAVWNAMKGGSDTITKLLDSISLVIPIESPCTIVDARLFLLFGVAAFRLEQIVSSKASIINNYGGTLWQYRNAASHRFSYKSFMKALGKSLCDHGKETCSDLQCDERALLSTPTASSTRRQPITRHDTRFQRIKICCPTTGDTPVRKEKRQKVYGSSDVSRLSAGQQEARSRRNDCTGSILVKCVNPNLVLDKGANPSKNCNHICVVCGHATKWRCLGCHHYMCATFERDEGYYIIDSGRDDTVICKKTCHIKFHLEALERDASQEDVPSVTPSLDRR
jgi:hypothetical protein